MFKQFLKLFFISLIALSSSFAQLSSYDEVLEGNINSDKTLDANKKYLLRGFVNVNEPATLTIPAGTIIYGEKSSKGTLIINRGAKIIANGTKEKPIIFTSQEPVGQRAAGDWGGIIIAGKARLNVPGGTAVIEGGTGTVYGGGDNPNDDDSSGVLRYIRIEFPGIAFLPDNEINGLTLAGVGRKTIIEYIQVSYSGDDSFEWFGGTVNCKYLVAFKGLDDDFDTDFGYRGKCQFLFGFRDPNIADISGSNGFESDNDGTGTLNNPRTQPIYSNVTLIGPLSTPDFTQFSPNFKRGAHLRRSTLTSIYNSIIMGYPVGLLIDGQNSVDGAIANELQIRNTIIAGAQTGKNLTTNINNFDVINWFNNPEFGNKTFNLSSEVNLKDPFNLSLPNPVPNINSPAVNSANFNYDRLNEPFFTKVNYIGAFSPDSPRWDEGWTNYDPQNTNYNVTSSVEDFESIPSEFVLYQNYPNPFNPSTTISFKLSKPSYVKLSVYNSLGQLLENLLSEYKTQGTYYINWNPKNLSTGIYYYTLQTEENTISKKMMLLK